MSCYRLALLIFLIQVARGLSEVTAPCEPGFSEQGYTFSVTRKVLERGRILGKVKFDSCSSAPRALFLPEDTRFRIISDGTVTVKRQITLHRGSTSFVLNAWDVGGKKHSVPIYVWNEQDQQVSA
ncbi:cadherin-1-like [Bombina bombina]|uniref:cadherin-1-like n=1 Tax=Bombina bombina TaxID=8345 RepID=UPI00235A95AB|nr:cadherin-1-like [Bombina bombina]